MTFSSGCADFRGRGASFSASADAAPEWEQELRTISASRLVCSGSKPAEIQTDRNVASVLCLNEKETSGYKTHTHTKKKFEGKRRGERRSGFRLSSSQAQPRWVATAVAAVTGQAHWLRAQSPVGAQARLDHTGAQRALSSMASQPGGSHTGLLGTGDGTDVHAACVLERAARERASTEAKASTARASQTRDSNRPRGPGEDKSRTGGAGGPSPLPGWSGPALPGALPPRPKAHWTP